MIAHRDTSQDTEAGALAAISESFQKKLFIGSIGRDEDSIAAVATRLDVVKGLLVFDADLVRNGLGRRLESFKFGIGAPRFRFNTAIDPKDFWLNNSVDVLELATKGSTAH